MPPRTITVLAYDGAQIIDITGPAEVFSIADAMTGGLYRIRIVSSSGADVVTSSGVRVGVHGTMDDAIAEEPAGDHRLAVLSARAGFSERQLTRMFARELGTTPARYVEQVRVEAARALLEASDVPLDAVARRCGLGSAESLRRSFTRDVGVTPHAYRQRFRTTGVRAG
jgi:transcriptional regulator GlxA family with amidase domain